MYPNKKTISSIKIVFIFLLKNYYIDALVNITERNRPCMEISI